MVVCVFRNFLDDFAITIWRGDVALDSRGIELALVFNIVERFNSGSCVDLPDLLAFFEKDSFHPHVRVDRDRVVVHEPAVENCLLNAVAEDRFTEKSDSVCGRCRGKADTNGVEMLERVTPNTRCLCAVAAMAFVGDYQIERMNWNVEAVSIFFYIRIATKLSERGFSAEQVPGHSLNRRDVNKSMTRFWCGQVFVR